MIGFGLNTGVGGLVAFGLNSSAGEVLVLPTFTPVVAAGLVKAPVLRVFAPTSVVLYPQAHAVAVDTPVAPIRASYGLFAAPPASQAFHGDPAPPSSLPAILSLGSIAAPQAAATAKETAEPLGKPVGSASSAPAPVTTGHPSGVAVQSPWRRWMYVGVGAPRPAK